VSRHVAVAIHVIDVAAVVAVEDVAVVTKVAFWYLIEAEWSHRYHQ
jgi:hypothetical protein